MTRPRHLSTEVHRPQPCASISTVSVVIPCYNYSRFLPEAALSALGQDGVVVDVIIVDDASTDDSVAVARGLAAGDPRVVVFENECNSGPVATFNRGLAAAKGEFVVRLDADDLLTPGSLARAVAVMQAFPRVGLVYGHPVHFAETREEARCTPRSWLVWAGEDWLAARCDAGTNVITSPEVVMRRSVVDVVGGQRDLAHTHDMEMWFRIAAHADVAYITGVDQAWHREHAQSLSQQAEDPRVILREIWEGFEVLFEGLASSARSAEAMRSAAMRAVAGKALDYARRDLDRGSRTSRVDDLVVLAEQIDPAVWSSPRGRSALAAARRARRWPAGLAALVGLAPRLARRLRERRQWARWSTTGVYEQLRVRSGAETRGAAI